MAFSWYSSWAALDPRFPALVSPTGTLSYGELRERVERQERSLRAQGAEVGMAGKLAVRDLATARSARESEPLRHTGDVGDKDARHRVCVYGRARAFTDERREF